MEHSVEFHVLKTGRRRIDLMYFFFGVPEFEFALILSFQAQDDSELVSASLRLEVPE